MEWHTTLEIEALATEELRDSKKKSHLPTIVFQRSVLNISFEGCFPAFFLRYVRFATPLLVWDIVEYQSRVDWELSVDLETTSESLRNYQLPPANRWLEC